MAYSDMYRSQSSNPSMSAIDGVEMKISERLAPPPMVKIPPEYQPGNPSEILFMEYDFGLEEQVIKWSQRQREQEEAMKEEATKKIAETIQTFSQTPDQSAAMATTAEQTPSSSAAESNANTAVAPGQVATNPSPFMNLGSAILTPMPIGSGHVRQESAGNKNLTGLFDLRDFENEQDPFENMELKVLDDREELNKMIFEVQQTPLSATSADTSSTAPVTSNHISAESATKTQEPSRPTPPGTPVNLKDVDYPEVESLDSGQYPPPSQVTTAVNRAQPYTGGQAQVQFQSNTQQAYYQPPQTITTNNLRYATPQGVNSNTTSAYPFSQNMPLPPIPKSQYLMQHGVSSAGAVYNNANSLSMPNAVTSMAGAGQANTNPVSMNHATGTAMYMPQMATDKGYMSYQNYYSRHSVTNQNTNTSNGHLLPQHDPSYLSGPTGRQTPPLNPLRSARSNPDISCSEERKPPSLLPSSHTPPPSARSSSPSDIYRSASPPARPLMQQNWNHYNVLPSTPRSSTNTPTSQKAAVSAKPKLPNPFDELSHDAQRYVESVTDMGFPRARVARAVQKLGNDDKQVIDHLCMVNRLAEQGHDSDDAEAAVILFQQNAEKAEQYLKLLSQFKEIGFHREQIQEALVSTDLDENKTLDLLTAS